ncbi:MAG: hypothetical protein AAFX80_05820 [Cyanobacteria bacterium J06639_18]
MSFKTSQLNFQSIRPWITLLVIIWLLSALGLGWLVNSLLILFGFLLLAPVLAFFGLRWWLQRSLVTGNCPVCSYELTSLKQTELQCPNCGEQLIVEQGHFQRLTPEGTIDVKAVEVSTPSEE